MQIVLRGVVGSTAYGLATPDSDVDRLGVYRAATREVIGLGGCEVSRRTYCSHDPDITMHELAKFCDLALRANPTILELLYLPAYEITTPAGEQLVALRRAFLAGPQVRNSYTGYALSQARRLASRHEHGKQGFSADLKKRTAKHGRHCLRLLYAGRQLLETGELCLDMSARRDELFDAGELACSDPPAFHELFETELAAVDDIDSVLPEAPDRGAVNTLLVETRLAELGDRP